jgi:hypothetical protein
MLLHISAAKDAPEIQGNDNDRGTGVGEESAKIILL